jgi:hypothetical protein
VTTYVSDRLRKVARDAAAAGLGELDVDQLDGHACVACGRETHAMVPLEHFFGGQQLFACEPGNPVGCRATSTSKGAAAPGGMMDVEINGVVVAMPPGAVAYKYADPVEDARWLFDERDATRVAQTDPSLVCWPIGLKESARDAVYRAVDVNAREAAQELSEADAHERAEDARYPRDI